MDNNHSSITLFSVCFIVAIAAQPSHSADMVARCIQDSDCNSDGYCSDNFCEVCVPCEGWLNREPASEFGGRKCAKTEEECGSCLPGFQSEELSNQRRSFKCAPFNTASERVGNLEVFAWEPFLFVAILCSVALAALATWYFTRSGRRPQASSPKSEETVELIAPSAPYLQPPPYNPMGHGTSPVDETDLAASLRHEIFEPRKLMNNVPVGATPIGPYHHHCEPIQPEPDAMELVEDEEVDIVPMLEFIDAASSDSIQTENSSTETIASPWEPGSVVSMNANESYSSTLAPPTNLYRARSQSFEHLPFFARPEHATIDLRVMSARSQRSRSDPHITFSRTRRISFAGETYAHRHVRLSAHRLQNCQAGANEQATSQAENIPENTTVQGNRSLDSMSDICDVYEADAPSPFAYSDDEMHSGEFPISINLLAAALLDRVNPMRARSLMPSESPAGGSNDSGFSDTSRRRRPNEEIEISIALFAKRSRHN